mgnify:CR=1 FL=1
MYLTRMELNTKNRDTMHLLSSPEKIHGLVESAFQGERKRNLWRIERLRGKMYLLILSPDQPDLKDGVERYGLSRSLSDEGLYAAFNAGKEGYLVAF